MFLLLGQPIVSGVDLIAAAPPISERRTGTYAEVGKKS